MRISIVLATVILVNFAGFSQKKKELLDKIASLKGQTAQMQAKLQKIENSKALNLEDDLQHFSYAFGVTIGGNLKAVGIDSISYNSFVVALEDVMKGKEKIDAQEAQNKVQTAILDRQEILAKEKSTEGELFLTENGKRTEVVTTESGLQYEILKQGNGKIPVETDKVKVHYSGELINGKVFDSSIKRGEPTTFGVKQVIKGWQEALQLMPVGSKWKVFIPQDLGYGQRGAGASIPPYATLIFEMELLAIMDK